MQVQESEGSIFRTLFGMCRQPTMRYLVHGSVKTGGKDTKIEVRPVWVQLPARASVPKAAGTCEVDSELACRLRRGGKTKTKERWLPFTMCAGKHLNPNVKPCVIRCENQGEGKKSSSHGGNY